MYIIIEMQTNNGVTTVVTPIESAMDENIALQKYYSTLSAAAVSAVQLHTVLLLNGEGVVMRSEKFNHKSLEE